MMLKYPVRETERQRQSEIQREVLDPLTINQEHGDASCLKIKLMSSAVVICDEIASVEEIPDDDEQMQALQKDHGGGCHASQPYTATAARLVL
jgi:hypothetical protein